MSIDLIIGSSVVGESHKDKNLPCQDFYLHEKLNDNECLIIVADGLGSAKYSHIGSKIAVESALFFIKNRIKVNPFNPKIHLNGAVYYARIQLKKEANRIKCALKDMATTLIVTYLCYNTLYIIHIGDGAIVIKQKDSIDYSLSSFEEREYINEVTPITSKEYRKKLKISIYSEVLFLAIFTDGCESFTIVKQNNLYSPYQPFWNSLYEYILNINDISIAENELKDFLVSDRIKEHSEDDKTLVLAKISLSKTIEGA